jgi:very-short-patch-repair endonuclease
MCKGKTDNVICQICNTEMAFGRIKRHIKSKHTDIKIEEYIKQYFQTLPLHNPCVVCNKNIVYKYQTCSKECHGKLTSSKIKGKSKPENFMDKKHKEKLSIKQKENWEQGKTIGFTGCNHTEEAKQIQRETAIKNKPHKGFPQSDYQKQQASIALKKWYSDGNQPYYKTNPISLETIEKIIKNSKKGMNNLEKLVSDILTSNNIQHSFNFFINNGIICKQFDFKIGKILLEIDGDYWHGGLSLKKHFYKVEEVKNNDLLKNKLAEERGYVLIRIWESEIKKNPNIILEKISYGRYF